MKRYITILNDKDEIIAQIDQESPDVILHNGFKFEETDEEPLMHASMEGFKRIHRNSRRP